MLHEGEGKPDLGTKNNMAAAGLHGHYILNAAGVLVEKDVVVHPRERHARGKVQPRRAQVKVAGELGDVHGTKIIIPDVMTAAVRLLHVRWLILVLFYRRLQPTALQIA